MTDPDRTARRERQFHSARDFETSASQIGDIEPLQDDIRRKMQLVIAASAKGRSKKAQVEDAVTLMMMLGVHPSQPKEHDPILGPRSNTPQVRPQVRVSSPFIS